MAARRPPENLFVGARSGGTIVAEQPPSPTAATPWLLNVSPFSSPPSSPPAKESVSLLRRQDPLPKECAVFHCRGCWAVLGDSLHLCAQEERRLGLLVCFKVTKDVIWEQSLMVGLEGALLGCAYYTLSCQSCGLAVGFILYSAPRDLAYLRGFFCFFRDSILCYVLENQMIMEASKVNFLPVTLKEQVQALKAKIVEAHCRIENLMRKLDELKQNNDVAERQVSSDVVGLLPGYAIVKVN